MAFSPAGLEGLHHTLLDAVERREVPGLVALVAHGGSLKPVYESLQISRKTLYEKMQKYGLDKKLLVSE